jgi:hypothetical protein
MYEEDVESDDSDIDYDEEQEDEETLQSIRESTESPLEFQERSLRQYFREMTVDMGLRSSPSSAHLALFEMAIHILSIPVGLPIGGVVNGGIRKYAARTWLQHFMDIKPCNTSDSDTKLVIESLQGALDPSGEVLRNIELFSNNCSLFGRATGPPERFLESLKLWSQRAATLPVGFCNHELKSWIQEAASSLKSTMMQLARGHVSNWFTAHSVGPAGSSFRFARNALLLVGEEV